MKAGTRVQERPTISCSLPCGECIFLSRLRLVKGFLLIRINRCRYGFDVAVCWC